MMMTGEEKWMKIKFCYNLGEENLKFELFIVTKILKEIDVN